jgi:LysR family transcriptional regulator of abg operon
MGASVSRTLMPAVITRFHAQHPQVKVRIMEGQLVSMINELRQGELDFTINTYYQGPYDQEFTFEKLFEKPFAVFCREGHPAMGATSINELLHYNWTMPTPRGSYYKQLEEVFSDRSQIPRIGVVCETFSSCISLVAQSDFLSILPQELGCDPLLAHRLVMLPVVESLPKAAYYLIQRRDSRQTPLAESLITQFRRKRENNRSVKCRLKTGSARHQTDPIVHTAVRPFANPEYYFHEAGIFRYNTFPEK